MKLKFLFCFLVFVSGHLIADTNTTTWNQTPEAEKEKIRQNYNLYQALPPSEQKNMHGRFERFQKLSPPEKKKIAAAYQTYAKASETERSAIMRKYEALPPEQKKAVEAKAVGLKREKIEKPAPLKVIPPRVIKRIERKTPTPPNPVVVAPTPTLHK